MGLGASSKVTEVIPPNMKGQEIDRIQIFNLRSTRTSGKRRLSQLPNLLPYNTDFPGRG